VLQRAWGGIRRFSAATHLGWVGLFWLAVASAVVGGSFLVLSAASEDVVRHNGLALADPSRLHWFVVHRPDAAVTVAKFLAVLGSPPVLAAVALCAGFLLWRRGLHLVLAAAPAVALGGAGVAAALTKAIVGRPRPPVGLHLVTENEPSFPSGHATDSTSVFLTLALVVAVAILRSPRARAAIVAGAVALGGAIGISRLTLGVHWPSDVIAGWALGTTVAVLVATTAVLVARTRPDDRVVATAGWRRFLARAHQLALAERTRPLTFSR
jgi:undecaprenyl-diphosphatase